MPHLQTLRLWRRDDFPWTSTQHAAVFEQDLCQLVEKLKEFTFLDIYGEIHIEKVEPYRLMAQTRFPNSRINVEHLDMDAEQRNDAIKEFRTGCNRILVRTDILGDDTDIPQVSPMINYDLPTNRESYIHRIGRSGRFGRQGTAINFITNDEQQTLKNIEQYYIIHELKNCP
ncbi:unnamed protein product [Rotaria socialis]|uniref:Helicase C-terminal domain-containing protein n=1 Tax=Rotaria socialis TaxID=392032 RepID=A0A818FRX3_9BILA|nr:unnamed protein product [Rotaria socialis]